MLLASDRLKRSTILASTRVLPRPLRVAARYRMLARLEASKGRRGEVFVIGHPKSGNTWLRTMLSRLYQRRHGLPESLILKSDELANRHPAIPRFLVSNGHYSYEGVIERTFREHPERFRDKRVVLLVRHPADIAVSWYLQFTKRISAAKRELIQATLALPVEHERISRSEFVRHAELGLPALVDYLNRWHTIVARLERHLVVRYEELRTETAATLARITAFAGQGFSPEEIREAVEWASFDNLRSLESSGFFRRGGLSLRDPEDPDTFKVRRGKIHGYRDDFGPEELAWMDALVAERLEPALGYASDAATATVGSGG
jgi:hypothetical protein